MSNLVRVADYIMTRLAAEGVKHVFVLPGGGAMYLVDALGLNPDMDYVPNHHEQACSIAAEAYARVNENLGVALVTTGPGATNAITGVVGAWIESVPMMVISGQVKRTDMLGDSGVRQMGPQEVDIVSIVKSVTKYAVTLDDPLQVRYHLEKALTLARDGRQGPVWLDVPLDVQASQIDPDALTGYTPESQSSPLQPGDLQIKQILDLLNHAERPLILAGHGIRLSGAADKFRRLYETLDIPVVTTWNAMDLIPHAHPLCVGKPGVVALRAPNFAVQNCDLLIAIGCRLDNVVTAYSPQNFARAAKKVVIDIDASELTKLDMPIDVRMQADAGRTIDALLTHALDLQCKRTDWLARCRSWKQRYPVMDGAPFPTTGPISHYQLSDMLSDEIAEGTLIVTGSSGLGVEAFYTAFRNKPGQRVFLTSGLGSMGYGLPAAIGACLAAGKKRMVAVESDGSLQLNIQELATLRGLDLPIIMFLMNNQGYASIRNTQRNYFQGRYVATGPEGNLTLPDLQDVAHAYGIPSMRIDDIADLQAGVRKALNQPGPFICEIMLMPNEILWPKVAAMPQADGTMISMPLEDMSPLLPLAQLQQEMLIPLHPASLSVKR
ncbi:acetolactate synthase [Sulfuriferula sp. AH1]|uniref:thiamine pyrophosphate-binding protein n=1 Tax=Sulfuriferula sp. AH1 TaxID=1985873 RepID=UPI000B3B0A44|nr:thiamine pyrophosphate-binding protein [Sulfuriferula sp. AH1]ARU31485.1 acetolactate synthase [Sulfuriferula sp. AH1]